MEGSVDTESTSMNSEGRKKLHGWLNKRMKICMTDGRTLIGTFLCTDKDRNVILGSCEEYVNPPDSEEKEDPRVLGLAMVPGPHIVSINVDLYTPSQAVV
ncbi:N-alpha-acetyltransferase 38-B, NatC auxiliary subunit-like isoform X2 [Ptychodera flava]|uniref:N-alpha-acetyltransferase 38-B, NatC auxiliary subunit-like isoform X2 n=1 Tax=Ptychodera flava TaxID=63121 RepID=UPI003969DF7E